MSDAMNVIGAVGGPIVRAAKRATLEIRVVGSVRRSMTRAGYRIDNPRLRQLIYSPGFQSRLAESREPDDSLIADLSDVILAPHRGSIKGALLLRVALVRAMRARLAGSSATTEFSDDRSEARNAELVSVIENHSNDEALFDHRLTTMHPLRASAFRELHQEWSGTARWLGTIVSAQDRLGLLKRWAAYPPDSLGAPATIFGLLADLGRVS